MGRNSSGTAGYGDDVRCPFFVAYGDPQRDARSILCEGDVPDTKSKMIFKGKTQRDFHAKVYCEHGYKRCEHYLSVMHHQWNDDQ